MINLTGKVAVVTGGARGIGEAISLTLAKAGAKVVVSDLLEEYGNKVVDEIKKLGSDAMFVKTDVSKEAEVNDLVGKAVERFGKLDIMVNNAGVSKTKVFVTSTEEELDFVLNVNLKGVYFGCKAALRHMIGQKSGKIINMSSMAGKEGYALSTLYSTSKFAVIGMTQAVAREYGEHNITCNAVCPGLIKTKMWTDQILKEGGEVMGVPGEAIWEQFVSQVPLKRPQEPQDIANTVLFLASDLASEITGQGINVNGGQVCH